MSGLLKQSGLEIVCALVVLPLLCFTSARAEAPPARIRVESFEVSSIRADSVEASLHLSVVGTSSGTLRNLVFDDVTVGGVHLRIRPIAGPVKLEAGRTLEGLPDLSVVLMYRELESLEPLRRAIRDGEAQIHASIRAQLDLNLFQKLALRTGGAWVTMTLDQAVPVSLAGGEFGRLIDLAALTAAEPAWVASEAAQDWLRNRTDLAAQVRSAIPNRLLAIETRYELKAKSGETVPLRHRMMGYLAASGQVLVPGEAVAPWYFDPALAQALDRGDVSLNRKAVEIVATVLDAAERSSAEIWPKKTFSLQAKEIRVGRGERRDELRAEIAVSPDTKRRYRLMFRNRNSNVVLLEIPALNIEAPTSHMEGPHPNEWQRAALVRLDPQQDAPQPVVFVTEARWDGERYQLKDLVDATCFGSPLWINGVAAAFVQDESSAADIDVVWKRLR